MILVALFTFRSWYPWYPKLTQNERKFPKMAFGPEFGQCL
jgi:hypothetical protein